MAWVLVYHLELPEERGQIVSGKKGHAPSYVLGGLQGLASTLAQLPGAWGQSDGSYTQWHPPNTLLGSYITSFAF